MEHNNRIFDTQYLQKDLKGHSVRSGAVTMASQGIQFLLRTGSTMILARLLTPADFGLVAMVATLVNFAHLFKDLGLSMATVQREKITHGQVSTLFWVNISISFLISVIVVAIAPLVASFYQEPRLLRVTLIYSSTFFLSGLAVQHQALLRRQMRFHSLVIVQVVSHLISIITAIGLAWLWRETAHAYLALVWMSVSQTLAFAIGTWLVCRWVPGLPRRGCGVRSMLRFGADVTGFNVINYFSRNLDNILIGKFWGGDALGLYDKAYKIVLFPLTNIRNPINAVALPVLSRLQNEPIRFRRYYGKIVFSLAFISMPIMAFCIVFPEELIRFFLGNQWLDATQVFRLLAVAGYIQSIAGTRGMLLLSCGQSKLYLKLGVLGALITITAFGIGVIWGITGVALSFVIVSYLPQYYFFALAFEKTPCSFRDLTSNLQFVALFSWIAVIFVLILPMDILPSVFFSLVFRGILMFLVYIGLFITIPRARRQLMETMTQFVPSGSFLRKLSSLFRKNTE